MLYNANNPILRIISVEYLKWESGSVVVEPRSHSALTFRIKGSAVITTGGRAYSIHASDILYLPQNMGYTAEYTDTELIVVHFITAQDDREIEVYSFENSEEIYKMFLRLLSLWKNREPGYSVYSMAQLYTILGTTLDNETKGILSEHFLRAVSFINSNYKNGSLSIDMVCAQAGIGATTFRLLFKKHYQKTPTEYITELRLEHARNLIAGGLSIENAAYESGFNDPKYFARLVKKHFGCTPRSLKAYGK